MKKLTIVTSFLMLFILGSCKKDKYTFYSTSVTFGEEGSGVGKCGWVILADRDKEDAILLKPVHIPEDMRINANFDYEALIEVLPEKFECIAGAGDVNPETGRPEVKLNYANILEFKEK